MKTGIAINMKKNDDSIDADAGNGLAQDAFLAMFLRAEQSHNAKHETQKNEQRTSAAQNDHAGPVALNHLIPKNIDANAE